MNQCTDIPVENSSSDCQMIMAGTSALCCGDRYNKSTRLLEVTGDQWKSIV